MDKKTGILLVILLVVVLPAQFAHVATLKNLEHTVAAAGLSRVADEARRAASELNEGDNSLGVGYIANAPRQLSVVQDWRSVCKQLCGAGLGGDSCGKSSCHKIETSNKGNVTTGKAKQLLGTNKDVICKDLCKIQFGGKSCGCRSEKTKTTTVTWHRNHVCWTFCFHSNITLTGCSQCVAMNQHSNNSDPLSVATTPITTTTTKKPTTPNWKEVCEVLCKTGDGGALCNCDKPPFF